MFESNYFVIEREKNFADYIIPEKNYPDYDIINATFDEIMSMDMSGFICSIMDFANTYFGEEDCETVVTLVNGEDDTFIWSAIIGVNEFGEDEFIYKFTDWTKEGKRFKYMVDE